jgi:polyferredoxin
MKDTIEIKTDDYEERAKKTEKKPSKRRKINKYGVYISIIFIAAGLIWYAINLGLIPIQILIQQAGPIIIVILGILILIKSL